MIVRLKVTGRLYFCKTVKSGKRFDRYFGSGVFWTAHLNKHGRGTEIIEKIWVSDMFFDTRIVKFAMRFSRFAKIVESEKWANLRPENGLDGSGGDKSEYIDYEQLVITKKKNGKTWTQCEESNIERSVSHKEYWKTDSGQKRKTDMYVGSKKEFEDNFIGPTKPPGHYYNNMKIHKCQYCGKIGDIRNMKRWHMENCKYKI